MNEETYHKKKIMSLTFSSGLVFIIQFMTTIILARIFSPDEFGVISAVLIIISFAEIFVQFGIGPSIVQRKNITARDINTAFTSSIFLGIFFTIILMLFAKPLSSVINIVDSSILVVISISFFINSFGVVSLAILQRELNFKAIILKDIFGSITYAVVAVILGIVGFGVYSLVIAFVVKSFIGTLISIISNHYQPKIGFDKQSFMNMFLYGIGYSFSTLFNYIATQGDYFVITRSLPTRELGIYQKSYQLVATPSGLVGQVIDQYFLPALSKVQDNNSKISSINLQVTTILALVYLPLGVLLYFVAYELVVFLLGNAWIDSVYPFQILSLFIFFRVSYKITDSIFLAKGAVYIRTFAKILYATNIVVFSLIGVKYGISGVAYGVGFALVINYLIMIILSYSLIKYNIIEYLHWIFVLFLCCILSFILISEIMGIIFVDVNIGIFVLLISKSVLILACLAFVYTIVIYLFAPKKMKHFLYTIIYKVFIFIKTQFIKLIGRGK
jgi:PST family polysaccharide transporter